MSDSFCIYTGTFVVIRLYFPLEYQTYLLLIKSKLFNS